MSLCRVSDAAAAPQELVGLISDPVVTFLSLTKLSFWAA